MKIMGRELIDRIIEKTRLQLSTWNRNILSVFLFSSQTKDAYKRFSSFAEKLFSVQNGLFIAEELFYVQNGLFIAPLSKYNPNNVFEKIRQKQMLLEISQSATTIFNIIVMKEEEVNIEIPYTCKKQIIELIGIDTKANTLSDKKLYVYKTDIGLKSLLIFSYFQGLKADISSDNIPSSPTGIITNSIIGSGVCDSWVQTLKKILSMSLNTSSEGESNDLMEKVEDKLTENLNAFITSISSFPKLNNFPIDENGISSVIPSTIKDRYKIKTLQFNKQETLKKLFGVKSDGSLRIKDFYINFFANQDLNAKFNDVWVLLNAWYYEIPLQWLIENLVTPVMKRRSAAEDSLKELKETSMKEESLRSEPNIDMICDELDKVCKFEKIYIKHAEIWFWEQILKDIRGGYFYSQSKKAKMRIEEQLNLLSNYKDGDYLINKTKFSINWSKNILDELEIYKPLPTSWDLASINGFFKYNCFKWGCFSSSDTGVSVDTDVSVYCLINCKDDTLISDLRKLNFNISPIKPKWFFSDDFPIHGIIILAVVPKKVFISGYIGGEQTV